MKPFKTLLATAIITLSVFSLTFYSCQKNVCKDVNCLNNGTCDKGKCICPTPYSGPNCEYLDKCYGMVCAFGGTCVDGKCNCLTGYEGPQCETVTRDRYLGPWIVTEDGTKTDAAQYTISVEKGINITELVIRNFRNTLTDKVKAFVKGDTIYIPQQSVNGNEVRGDGWIMEDKFYGKDGKIVIRYYIISPTGMKDEFGYDGVGDPSLWNK